MKRFLAALLCCLPFCVPDAHASLADRYPTDSFGRVAVPAIQQLADAVTLNGTPAYCVPTSKENYGWISDRGDPDQGITETSYDDGLTFSVDWNNVQINVSGDICSQLERLTRYPQTAGYFRQKLPQPWPLKKGDKGKPRGFDVFPNYNTYDAAVGILSLVHEALHVRMQSLDEALVECTAFRNLWPTTDSLHLPGWLNKQLLADASDNHFDSPDEYLKDC